MEVKDSLRGGYGKGGKQTVAYIIKHTKTDCERLCKTVSEGE